MSGCPQQVRQQAQQESERILETIAQLDDEEEETMPPDLESLSYEDQQANIQFRAAWMMAFGTVIITIFSYPLVDCLTQIGDRIGIRPFYVAFVLAPFISDIAVLVAISDYAAKKTSKSMSICMTTLLVSAIMMNTFVLGMMMVVIYVQGLYYEFLAETVGIILVHTLVITYILINDYHTVFDGFLILAIYPLALGVVWSLDTYGGLG